MTKLHFAYDMHISYSTEVSDCHYTIKCIPEDTLRQRIERIRITMTPKTCYQWGRDGLKNLQIWGVNAAPHASFRFQIEGDAVTGLSDHEEAVDEDLAMVFAHPHGLNAAGPAIRDFYRTVTVKKDMGTFDTVKEITRTLYDNFEYRFGATDVDTSAEEAFRQGCGVCQDYAHILIALLHLAGITARYVTGFIIGEGASHAWVEFSDGDKWYGIDPTHNRPVNDEYIKIGHGRDAKDCMINRGIMHGDGTHTQRVSVSVQKV